MFCVRRGKFLRCRESQLKWQSQTKEFPETLKLRRFDRPFSISFPSVVNLLLFNDLEKKGEKIEDTLLSIFSPPEKKKNFYSFHS